MHSFAIWVTIGFRDDGINLSSASGISPQAHRASSKRQFMNAASLNLANEEVKPKF